MNWIEAKFGEADYEVRLKLKPLYFILICMLLLSILIFFTDMIGPFSIVRFISHVILMGITVFSLVVLRRGHYSLSSRFTFILLFLVMDLMRLQSGYTGLYSIPLLVSILCSFIILSAIFIGNNKIIAIMCGMNFLSYLYIVILGIMGGEILKAEEGVSILIFTLIAEVATSVGVLLTRHVFDKVVRHTIAVLTKVELKNEQGKALVRSSLTQMAKSGELLEKSQESASAGIEIERNVESISDGMVGLNGKLKSSEAILDFLNQSVHEMKSSIEKQSSQVGHSASAIEQIVAGINSVGQIIAKEEQSFAHLREKSQGGQMSINEALESIGQVNDQVDNIRGMTSMIAQIASQTNLLAMGCRD